MPLDLNFYAEQHMDELDGMLDVEVPPGWDIARLIQALYDAKMMLLGELLHVDDDGEISWW